MANPPGAFGVDHLTRLVNELSKKIDRLLAGVARLERKEAVMATDIEQLDEKLDAVAAQETKLGQDIKTVVDTLKSANLPPNLQTQLAKLDKISQDLIQSDVDTLANLPPAPPTP